MHNREVAILVPLFNEERNIAPLYEKLCAVTDSLRDQVSFNFLFVDDGSSDDTGKVLELLAQKDERVGFLQFSRNFGKEIATSAALHHAKGDAAIMLDADLQHPVELIPEFIQKWINGAEVVVGIRRKHGGTFARRVFSSFFYWSMNAIGDTKMISGSTDFRLVDGCVIREFSKFQQHNRMTRNLIDWMGFRRDFVSFDAPARANGDPVFSLRALTRLATTTLVANSLLPLRIAGFLGVVITTLAGLLGFSILIGKYIVGQPFLSSFSGPAQLAILITFLVGVVLVCLGVMSMYIAQIHDEALGRPLYVIRNRNLRNVAVLRRDSGRVAV